MLTVDVVITVDDADDPRVDDFRRLHDHVARRDLEGDRYFVSEGWVSIERLIDSGHAFRSVLLSPSRVNRFLPFLQRSPLDGVPVFVAEHHVMRDIVGFDLPRGVLVSAQRKPLATLEDLATSSNRLVVLEALDDGERVGAIARAARAFDFEGMVLDPTCTDPYQRRTVRVSMGEILHMRVARTDRAEWPGAIDVLHAHGFETWALTPGDDADRLWDLRIPDRVAILLSAAGRGSTSAALTAASRRVRIPTGSTVRSLDVGHAAAIAFAAVSRPPRR